MSKDGRAVRPLPPPKDVRTVEGIKEAEYDPATAPSPRIREFLA